MAVLSTDPFKPLSEVERVFCNEQYLRMTGRVIVRNQVYVTFALMVRLLGVSPEVGQKLRQTEGWRTEKWDAPIQRPINLYALADVRPTKQRLAE